MDIISWKDTWTTHKSVFNPIFLCNVKNDTQHPSAKELVVELVGYESN